MTKIEYGAGTYTLSKQSNNGSYEEIYKDQLLGGVLVIGHRPLIGNWYLSRIIDLEKTGKGYRFLTENSVYLLEKINE